MYHLCRMHEIVLIAEPERPSGAHHVLSGNGEMKVLGLEPQQSTQGREHEIMIFRRRSTQDEDAVARIGDFGLAEVIDPRHPVVQKMRKTAAPELILNDDQILVGFDRGEFENPAGMSS